MKQSDPDYKSLLLGYISNSISVEEVKELYLFIQEEPELYALLMDEPGVLFQVKHQIEASFSTIPVEVEDRFRQRIKKVVENAKGDSFKSPSVFPLRIFNKNWLKYAAVIIICIGIGIYFWISGSRIDRDHTKAINQSIADA